MALYYGSAEIQRSSEYNKGLVLIYQLDYTDLELPTCSLCIYIGCIDKINPNALKVFKSLQ